MSKSEKHQDPTETLNTFPIFKDLEPSIQQALNQAAILRSYSGGQIVCFEDDSCEGFYIVREGWLKTIKISSNGREQIFRFIGPGETFNEVGLLTNGRNQTTAAALEPAKVWLIPNADILQLLDQHPPLIRIFTQNLADHVVHLMSLVENLSLLTVEARLARIFLEHSTSNQLNRRKWSTQAEMAARLGTVPDVLNRSLNRLAVEGLIQIERQQIIILDRPGLERKAMRVDGV